MFTILFITIIGFRYPKLFVILLIAFILRVGLTLINDFLIPLPDSQADAVMFQKVAEEWASNGFPSVLKHLTTGAFFYSWILAVIYSLTEPLQIIGQGINVFLGVVNVYLVWLIGKELSDGNKWVTQISSYIAALFPTLILYSAITMREAFITFFFLLGSFYFIKWNKTNSYIQFGKGVIAYVISGLFHTGMFIALLPPGIYAFFMLIRKFLKQRGIISIDLLKSVCILLIGVSIVLTTGWGMEKLGVALNLDYSLRYVSSTRAGYLQGFIIKSPFDLIWQSPIRLFFFLFSPFPWMLRSIVDFFAVFDSLLYFIMVFSIIKNRKNLRNANETSLKLTLVILMTVMIAFAIATSNYGQAIRHRAKFAPLLIPITVTLIYGSNIPKKSSIEEVEKLAKN